jgi:hypothetical protein
MTKRTLLLMVGIISLLGSLPLVAEGEASFRESDERANSGPFGSRTHALFTCCFDKPGEQQSQGFWQVRPSHSGTQPVSRPRESRKWPAAATNLDGSREVPVGARLLPGAPGSHGHAAGFLAAGILLLLFGTGVLLHVAGTAPSRKESAARNEGVPGSSRDPDET